MSKQKSKKINNGPTMKDWKSIMLPETQSTKGVDLQKILREVRYGK